MKHSTASLLTIICTAHLALCASYYVAHDGANVHPYATPKTAANTIQTAIDAASDGDTVLVSTGIYTIGDRVTPGFASSNRVVITKRITVMSEAGPANTIIVGDGPNGPSAVRCVFMTNAARLVGFTLSNGHTHTTGTSPLAEYIYNRSGGGLLMVDGCYVSNCVFVGNVADHAGGGMDCYYGGTADYCTFIHNVANNGGGVRFLYGRSYSLLRNSVITSNSAAFYGGGVNIDTAHDVKNCFVSDNVANVGGGVYLKSFWDVEACIVSNNRARISGGGVYIDSGNGHNNVRNSLIIDNIATNQGGGVYHNQFGVCYSCTIVRNTAGSRGGGIFSYLGGFAQNCIIYYNTAPTEENYGYILGYFPHSYCCTEPFLTNSEFHMMITNAPVFENMGGNDFRLWEFDTCIDTGLTVLVYGALDLAGNPRVHNDIIDLGAYELVPEPLGIGVLWVYLGCAMRRRRIPAAAA